MVLICAAVCTVPWGMLLLIACKVFNMLDVDGAETGVETGAELTVLVSFAVVGASVAPEVIHAGSVAARPRPAILFFWNNLIDGIVNKW